MRVCLFLLAILLTACTAAPSETIVNVPPSQQSELSQSKTTSTAAAESESETKPILATPSKPTPTKTINETPSSGTSTPTNAPRLQPSGDDWKSLPVIPEMSSTALDVYRLGLEMGNNPAAFSKIGDCESVTSWFLGDFDLGTEYYSLGDYSYLQDVINYFQGSYNRTSLAARRGFTASSALTPLWADRTQCEKNETPLACEYRIHRPVLAFIMLGTNDVFRQDTFETQLRAIIEYSLSEGIVPVLATKADNLEGDHSINATIARVAWEYDIPLWNFWSAVQSLPDQGLQADRSHLTWGLNQFDNPAAMKRAWPVRNLTALQVLDTLWRQMIASVHSTQP